MVKSKNKKSVIALVVMAFLLVASICLAATGAWFTSKVDERTDSLNFGTIAISSDVFTVTATGTKEMATTDLLMPDDTLTITYNIKNEGAAAFVIAKVDVTATTASGTLSEAGKTAIQSLSGTYSGNNKATTECASLADGTETPTTETWTHTVRLTGNDFGNDFQGATVQVKVTILAIQQENLSSAEAFTLLTGTSLKADGTVSA